MMNEWFECKVKYERTMDDGKVKKVNEPYLVDALSFTEAEERIIENAGQPAIRLPRKSFNNDADAVQVQNLGIDIIGTAGFV